MIGFPLGLLAANAVEWLTHKYTLHGLGRRRGSFWSFHWHEHHRQSRRNGFRDPDYERPALSPSELGKHAQGKEALALLGVCAAVTPLVMVAPWFVAGTYASSYWYYAVHKKAHLDPEWARRHLPWHYDHHMGPNQDANWCVTSPLFDHIMGTREPYVGTELEARDRERSARWQARREAA